MEHYLHNQHISYSMVSLGFSWIISLILSDIPYSYDLINIFNLISSFIRSGSFYFYARRITTETTRTKDIFTYKPFSVRLQHHTTIGRVPELASVEVLVIIIHQKTLTITLSELLILNTVVISLNHHIIPLHTIIGKFILVVDWFFLLGNYSLRNLTSLCLQ